MKWIFVSGRIPTSFSVSRNTLWNPVVDLCRWYFHWRSALLTWLEGSSQQPYSLTEVSLTPEWLLLSSLKLSEDYWIDCKRQKLRALARIFLHGRLVGSIMMVLTNCNLWTGKCVFFLGRGWSNKRNYLLLRKWELFWWFNSVEINHASGIFFYE